MGKKGKKKAKTPGAASASCSQLVATTQPLAALDTNSVSERDAEQADLEAACARAGLDAAEREKEHAILRACRAAAAEFALATALPLRGAHLVGEYPQNPGPYDDQMEAWRAQMQQIGYHDWDDWDDGDIRLYASAFREYGPYVA